MGCFYGVVQLLTGANRHVEPMFDWRNRARPPVIAGAEGIVGQADIDRQLSLAERHRLQVAPGTIGLFASKRVSEE
jgi:hypothetical protein